MIQADKLRRAWAEENRRFLLKCPNPDCEYINHQQDPVMANTLTSTGRFGTNHKCSRCGTRMPWLDHRTYGKKEVHPFQLNNGLQRKDHPFNRNITVWNFGEKHE